MTSVLAIILGGGKGERLRPLTSDRTKPAVPIGGQYRIMDVPVTNCLRSDISKIIILTQFNSESLNRHISRTYKFDYFSKGFVEILAAEQSQDNADWFQGTADAVRKNVKHIKTMTDPDDLILILSGDQLYKMDFRHVLASHLKRSADITVCCKYIPKQDASSFGIMKIDGTNDKIIDFVEKPQGQVLEALRKDDSYLASMGIYIFKRKILFDVLDKIKNNDFGKHIIPYAINNYKTCAYKFTGYWEDIGTIKAFYNSNIDIASSKVDFDFNYVYTHPRFLAPSKIINSNISDSIVAEGTVIKSAKIQSSIIGLRSIIGENVKIKDSIIMGADYYEAERENTKQGIPRLGIGDNCIIEKAIIDKNARIGNNVVIKNKDNLDDVKFDTHWIRDGVVIIPKGTIIPDGVVI